MKNEQTNGMPEEEKESNILGDFKTEDDRLQIALDLAFNLISQDKN